MKGFLNKTIDICLLILSSVAALALGFLLVAICYATFSRFLFNKPLSNLVEYASYSLLYITFLGSPQILKNRGHINIDIITNMLSKEANARLSVCVNLVGAAISFVITYYGTNIAVSNYQHGIRIMDSMGTPQYLLTSVIPIGMLFMGIQFVRNGIEDYSTLKGAV